MYSTGLNAICHMSGNFYEGRSAKFWYVLTESYNMGKLNSEDIFTSTHPKKKSQTDALNWMQEKNRFAIKWIIAEWWW